MAMALLTASCSGGGALSGFTPTEVLVGGEPWPVLVADEAAERERGLMGVTDLGEARGMLFVFPEDTTAGFWMKDTPLALDIAFFAADGSLVEVMALSPCRAAPCPTYRPAGPYRYALEVPAGGFSGVEDLRLDPEPPGR
ncbi:MAG: DUF192 domain-containing protein [Actinobacteria bacterium]|nr:DUF192 domain-containing protein [Actinomycetota bacterium]